MHGHHCHTPVAQVDGDAALEAEKAAAAEAATRYTGTMRLCRRLFAAETRIGCLSLFVRVASVCSSSSSAKMRCAAARRLAPSETGGCATTTRN